MIPKKIILISLSCLFVLAAAWAGVSAYQKMSQLKRKLAQSELIGKKLQDDLIQAKLEQEESKKEDSKAQLDTVSYLEINSKLQAEKDSLQERLLQAQKIVEDKEADLGRITQKLAEVESNALKERTTKLKALAKEKSELGEKLAQAKKELQGERALYHYNLATALSQAGSYDQALEEYEQALSFDQNNPDAHYNAGLLYEQIKNQPQDALSHFQKYVELSPEATDLLEVKAWIARLEALISKASF